MLISHGALKVAILKRTHRHSILGGRLADEEGEVHNRVIFLGRGESVGLLIGNIGYHWVSKLNAELESPGSNIDESYVYECREVL
jgi:hypothetical protein